LLVFAIPYSGYGQVGVNPLTFYPTSRPFYLGLNGGLNYSKINYDDASTEYLPSVQLAIEFQSFLSSYKNARSTLLYGVSYELKQFSILNSSNESIQLESSYLSFPIKYQYYFTDLQKSIPVSVVLGGFYSFKLDESSIDKDIEYLPNSNYGIIVGPKIEIILNYGFFLNLDYNFQYGFASLKNSISTTNNISHIINIGFKFPSTVF